MIGLVDYALQSTTSIKLSPPNLEIMKLATYYRNEENLFCKLVDLKETDLTAYEKIFFFCEDNIKVTIPPQFLRANNVIYGGTAFTDGIYKPFDNPIIDFTLPSLSIYKEFFKEKYQDGIKYQVINQLLDNSYYRMRANNEHLPIPPIRSKKRVYIYDKNIFCDGWQKDIEIINDRLPSSIVYIHPIICNTLKQYFQLREFNKIAKSNKYILDLNVPIAEIPYLLKEYKNKFLADIAASSEIGLSLGGSFASNFQYFKDLIYKLNLLYSFWSKGIDMKILYINPRLGYTDPLANLSNLIATWSKRNKKEKSINDRIVYKDKKRISAEQKERDLLLKFYPHAKELFNQTYEDIKARGVWRL